MPFQDPFQIPNHSSHSNIKTTFLSSSNLQAYTISTVSQTHSTITKLFYGMDNYNNTKNYKNSIFHTTQEFDCIVKERLFKCKVWLKTINKFSTMGVQFRIEL